MIKFLSRRAGYAFYALGTALISAAESTGCKQRENADRRLMEHIAHDVKDPLTTIVMAVSSSEADPGLPPGVKNMLHLANKSAQFQRRILESMQRVPALENSEFKLSVKPLPLRGFLEDCVNDAQFLNCGKTTKVETALSPENAEIKADGALLRCVIVNLLLDSMKYGQQDGVVKLSADVLSEGLSVRVADSGTKMSPDFLKAFFDKYPPEEHYSRHFRRGIGLNRYYCKLAVAAQGGKIRAENSDDGLAVCFTLPQDKIS